MLSGAECEGAAGEGRRSGCTARRTADHVQGEKGKVKHGSGRWLVVETRMVQANILTETKMIQVVDFWLKRDW